MARVIDLAAYRAARGAPEPWTRKAQLARHFSVSERTVERWQTAGMPFRKVSRGLVMFRISECEQWAEQWARTRG